MEQKKKGIRSSLRKANSLVHTLKNLYDKASDREFREFEIMEYDNVENEGVTDLKRLDYLKRLQLAQNGYVGNELKKKVAQQKERQRLIDQDTKILPFGNLKINDGELLRAELHLGYEPEQNTFQIAYTEHEKIPKWKHLDMAEFIQFTARIHPNGSDNLRLEHDYLGICTNRLSKNMDYKRVYHTYNHCVSEAFHGNRYFSNGVLDPDENLLENPELYMGKQFRLQVPGGPTTIATLSEANGHYLSFRSFLEVAPNPETRYFTIGEFKHLFLDSQIELIAHLKFDLRLGVKDGILHIGHPLDESLQPNIRWDRYDDIIKTSELPMKVKYYLCKDVIMNKNFVVEKDAVHLESQGKKAFLKKHYGTGKWHFAEIRKPSDVLHFRPITPDVSKYIRQQYSESANFSSAEKRKMVKNTGKRNWQMRH